MPMNRREALTRLFSFAGLAALGTRIPYAADTTTVTAAANTTTSPISTLTQGRKRALRIAHITDVHISEKGSSEAWFARCLHHIQNQADAPSLIINTGDSIMDSLKTDRARADMQWALWNKVVKNECSLPMKSVLGNHDIWGWMLEADSPAKSDPVYGKARGLDGLGLEKPYYTFEQEGWHFVMLDSAHEHGLKYTAKLGDEQFDWLRTTLRDIKDRENVIVFSHIPILAACIIPNSPQDEETGGRLLGHASMHSDAPAIVRMFRHHKDVKACFSGHIHLLDRIDLNDVSYCCNGAVSGSWWKGDHHGVNPGYTMLNLYTDGSFDREYVGYGWTA